MSDLSAPEARDHVEMIQRILAESHQRLCSGGEFFIVWGLASAFITVVAHLAARSVLPQTALISIPVVLVGCSIYSIVRGRQTRRMLARTSLLQREFFNVLWLTIGLAFVVDVAVFNIFAGIASAAIWSVAEAIVLLYIGMHGNRRAQIAGVLVVVSLIVANFVDSNLTAYVLAAGMLAGYAGFGIGELLSHE